MDLQNTQGGILRGSDRRREDSREGIFTDHSSFSPQTPSVPLAPYPPTGPELCLTTPAPPRNPSKVSQHYSKICKTHKRLVREGKIKCSISLSNTPPTVNLPSAPGSPDPEAVHGASVRWGEVAELSGVQTPYETPASSSTRHTVITPLIPVHPPRPTVSLPFSDIRQK